LCKARDSLPEPVDYRELSMKFSDTLDKLQDPELDAGFKNRHLKDILEKIVYDRPPTVRITNENKELLGYDKLEKGKMFHTEPFEISIIVK